MWGIIALVICYNEIKQRKISNKCKLIPKEAKFIEGKESEFIKKLFVKAVKEYKKNNIDVKISQYDLFHCHKCDDNNRIIFHAKEYPENKNWNLGYCQIDSDVSMKDFNKRNLVYYIDSKKVQNRKA